VTLQKPDRRHTWNRIILLAAVLLFLSFSINSEPRPTLLVLVGDMMFGRGVAAAQGMAEESRALDLLAPMFRSSDLAAGNLESPLSDKINLEITSNNLCAPAEAGKWLAEAGVGLVSLANNHSADCAEQGIQTTAQILSRSGILGIGLTPQAVFRSANGLDLAFIAVDGITQPVDIPQLAQEVQNAHEKGAVVIVSLHWGHEYQPAPDANQENLAQALADSGASLVWGHHPHVLQPAQWLQGKAQKLPTLVLYSLGNVLFDQAGLPDTRRSAAALIWLGKDGVISAGAVPFDLDVRKGLVIPATPTDTAAVRDRLGDALFRLDFPPQVNH
jgi:poly-gamma-glutamate synthesis protein (capsule biosynthesis protein)